MADICLGPLRTDTPVYFTCADDGSLQVAFAFTIMPFDLSHGLTAALMIINALITHFG